MNDKRLSQDFLSKVGLMNIPPVYRLDNHTPVKTNDLDAWVDWFQNADRRVARTTVGDAVICTDFLGLDHQYGDGPPLLFETMVFGGEFDQDMTRCSTWDQAEQQHRDMVYKLTVLADDT